MTIGKGKRPRDPNQLAKWIVDRTTMHGGLRQSDCSGCQYRAGAGGSIGRERIAVRDFRGRGGSYLCSIYRNVRLIRG
jgi:hypothetical protein